MKRITKLKSNVKTSVIAVYIRLVDGELSDKLLQRLEPDDRRE